MDYSNSFRPFCIMDFSLDPARLDPIHVKRFRRCDIRATCICIGLHTPASLSHFSCKAHWRFHVHTTSWVVLPFLDFTLASSSLLDSAFTTLLQNTLGARDGRSLFVLFIWIPNHTGGLGTTASCSCWLARSSWLTFSIAEPISRRDAME